MDYAFHFVLTEDYKKQLVDLEDILKEGMAIVKAVWTIRFMTECGFRGKYPWF